MSSEKSWRKSSYSGAQGGDCTEVATVPGAVLVRDTNDRTGPALRFTPATWRRFADRVKRSLALAPKLGSADAFRGHSRV